MRAKVLALLAGLALVRADAAAAAESAEYLFRLHCSGCHGLDGAGSKIGRIPPFPGIVGRFAANNEGRLYLVHVPGVANAALPDAQTASVLNYVLHKWNEGSAPADQQDFTVEEVHRLRDIHVDDVASLRTSIELTLARLGISLAY
jgi:mono/diheme cytochrome c family protein